MAYLALYRRYRPITFENLIGQEHIVSTLVNQIENQRLGHAYLFTGTRGTGKTSAAKIFAKAINCENPKNGSPCGECETCKRLQDPSNIDIVEIDAASNNGVNEIRELKENVQYPPVSCKYKVYIIDEVHMLSGAAFNALLKTLEEPPKHAVFILATTEVHKIPATILSRCMRFDFRLISVEQISKLISKIYDEQGKEYEKEAVIAIAKAGEGSIRDALSIADIALSYNNGKLTYDNVMDILGSSNAKTLLELVKSIMIEDTGAVLENIDKLSAMGKSVGVLIRDIISTLRDLLVIKTCENANEILNLPLEKFNELKSISDLAVTDKVLRAMEEFSQAESSLKYSNHPKIVLETTAIKSAKPQADYNIDALLTRIKTLEEKLEKGEFNVSVSSSVLPIPTASSEENNQNSSVEVPQAENKKSISTEQPHSLKAKILSFLRKNQHEMLWNIMQSVIIEAKGNILVLTPFNSTDLGIIDKESNVEIIKESLSDYASFEVQIAEFKKEKLLEEVDLATERIKSIFGDDIVIIKK